VMVWGEENDEYGARHVGEIYLSTVSQTTTQIAGIYIKGNLGHEDYSLADEATTGIYIEGDLLDMFVVSSCAVDVEVGGDVYDNLSLGNMTGDVTIGGNLYDGITFSRNGTTQVLGSGPHTAGGCCGDFPFSGDVSINGSLSGNLVFRDEMAGTVDVAGAFSGIFQTRDIFSGTVQIQGNTSPGSGTPNFDVWQDMGGQILIDGSLGGLIDIDGDLVKPGRIEIADAVNQSDPNVPAIHIHGWIDGTPAEEPEDPMVEVGGELDGIIAIDGGMNNAVNGPEIQVGSLDPNDPNSLGAITIDYDGWNDADDWDPNAVIKVDTTEYTENTPAARVYRISKCKGDLDNDRDLDSVDQDAMDLTMPQYASARPGLLESHYHHADVDDDHDVDGTDATLLDWLITEGCTGCMTGGQLDTCNADIVEDGIVDLADLAQLLAHYGTTTGATRNDGDLDDDGDVELADLAELLSHYSGLCGCFDAGGGGEDGGGGGEDSTYVTVTVAAYNTGGYSGGGFSGEVDHFVFDLKIEVDDPNNDDWLVTGAVLDASNDATFLLSTTATTPNQYATFVAAPWTSVPGTPTADLAGAYDPPDPNEVFTTTALNLGWYDTAESNDGPATVMRLVIDVSEVDGADVSGGFGSVYFSTTGPANKDDILVADLASGTSTVDLAPALRPYSGEFYVIRE
jgi:hypothetical protein